MRSLTLGLFVFLLCLSCASFAVVRGSGVFLAESRSVPGFSGIAVSGGVELMVRRGDASLRIEGDDNIVPLYKTEVVNDVLRIEQKPNVSLSHSQKLKVYVTTPALKQLTASGGVTVTLDSVLAGTFSAELSGGVELAAQAVSLETLTLDASGGTEIAMSGQAKTATFTVSGGGEIKAAALQVGSMTIDATGGATLDVTATESITGHTSGGGSVTIHGNPPKSRLQTSGGSSVDYVN